MTEASKSQQVAQFLKVMLKGVGPSAALGRDTKMLRDILDKTVDRIGKDLKGQPGVEAELRTIVGQVYTDLGDSKNARVMFSEALSLREKLFGKESLEAANSLADWAYVLRVQGKPAEAEPLLRQALAMQRKLLAAGHPLKAIADVLGHASTQTTYGYTRVEVDGLRSVAISAEEVIR
jgi:tetratricopeptide (TPR) repeat protein